MQQEIICFLVKYAVLPLERLQPKEKKRTNTFLEQAKKLKFINAQKKKDLETMVKNILTCYLKKDYVFIYC